MRGESNLPKKVENKNDEILIRFGQITQSYN